jgi:hypothetical protein
MADPINPRIELRASTSSSLLEVDADPTAFGKPTFNWQKSKMINGETRVKPTLCWTIF